MEPAENGAWDVWVHSDDDLPRASQWLSVFRANPDDPQFQSASPLADELRAREDQEVRDFQKRLKTSENLFRRFVTFRIGPVTTLLIAVSIGVFIWTGFASELIRVPFLFFSEFRASPDIVERMKGSPEIQAGQLWRLITPIFIHMNILHILFNLLWLRELGAMVETVEGTIKLFLLIVVSAVISNWAQYVIGGSPLFGGMSGVVYALLGYVWMKGKFQPGLGMYLHKNTVILMMAWLAFGFTNIMPIANWAHLGGLIVGVAWGYLGSRR